MQLLAGLALTSLAMAAPLVEKRWSYGLDVELELEGNSKVKAVITNNGQENLKVLKAGTFLDTAAVEKAQVYSGNCTVPFEGVRVDIHTGYLTEKSFEHIPAGQSIIVEFDVAELHDLSVGGRFDISTSGALSYAAENSTTLIGSVPYESNLLEADVDGDQAFQMRAAFQKRSIVQSDCSGQKLSSTQAALHRAGSLASAAQKAALSGSADKMTEYFKSSTSATRNTVAGVFGKIASETASTTSGDAKFYCGDVYGACSDGVLAYTVPGLNYMSYCDLFFTALPASTSTCHSQEQGTTVLHESTHLSQVKGTLDYGGYGYEFVRSLTAAQNLNHADTYAMFANAINLGC